MWVIRRVLEIRWMGFGKLTGDCFQQKRFYSSASWNEPVNIPHTPTAPSQVIYRIVSRASFARHRGIFET